MSLRSNKLNVLNSYPDGINQALKVYDKKKSLLRRLIGDAPAVKALRKLSDADKNDHEKILACFAVAPPSYKDAAWGVYEAALRATNRYGVLRTAPVYTMTIPRSWPLKLNVVFPLLVTFATIE